MTPPVFRFLQLVLILTAVRPATAVDRYVSTTGSDAAAGTQAAPWRTVQKAASTALAGETVFIRQGIYDELVTVTKSGSAAAGYITFRSYPGETAEITGYNPGATTWRSIPTGEDLGILTIISRSYLRFQDLVIRNFGTTNSSDALGIYVTGASHHIEIRNCRVHHIQTITTGNNSVGNANGIGVFGRSGTTAITDIIVDGCEISDLITGWSESVVFNGNVNGFQFSNNSVHNCNNIGIDCIGFEGTAPANDQARNGLISGNTVYNIDSSTNPVYNGGRSAAGIYVDGGTAITIEKNLVHHCNFGVELASEHVGRTTSNCICRENLIWNCHGAGITIGGSDAGNGGCLNCSITHNTLYKNATMSTPGQEEPEFQIQNHCTGNSFLHNIVRAETNRYCVVNWATTSSTGNTIDWNCYYTPLLANGSTWSWNDNYIEGFNAWKSATGFDTNSLFADPLLTGTTSPVILRVTSGSPAINRGNTAFSAAVGQTDIDKMARVEAGRVDIGADEFVLPTLSITALDATAAEWGANPAVLRLARSGPLVSALSIPFSLSGTATNSVDYPALVSPATLTSGQEYVDISIAPTSDSLAEGQENLTLTLTSNAAYTLGTPNTSTISIDDRPIDAWKKSAFGPNANQPSIAGDLQDPDRDGVLNVMEYALNLNPLTAGSTQGVTGSVVAGYLTLQVARNPAAIDLDFLAEVSGSTTGWNSGSPHTSTLTDLPSLLVVRDATPATAPRRLMRLRVARK